MEKITRGIFAEDGAFIIRVDGKEFRLDTLTRSESKIISSYLGGSSERKILNITRSIGGKLLITSDRISVRETDKHEPPFKYHREMFGNRGGLLKTWKGNICDGEDIIDDRTQDNATHINGYKS